MAVLASAEVAIQLPVLPRGGRCAGSEIVYLRVIPEQRRISKGPRGRSRRNMMEKMISLESFDKQSSDVVEHMSAMKFHQ
jgi:hypothetical protein